MPIGWFGGLVANVPEPVRPKVGRPQRDRKKISASRRTARRNHRR